MLRRPLHHIELAHDEFILDFGMKEVAHAVDEDTPWFAPPKRLFESIRPRLEIEALLERMTWDAAEAFCKAFSIAILATGANLRAACNGVPRCVRPFDSRVIGHHLLTHRHRSSTSLVGDATGTAIYRPMRARRKFLGGRVYNAVCDRQSPRGTRRRAGVRTTRLMAILASRGLDGSCGL